MILHRAIVCIYEVWAYLRILVKVRQRRQAATAPKLGTACYRGNTGIFGQS